ncbi:MAG: hypothetical protein Q8L06_09895, partial [Pseudohongiella sp.]|nr:hypothetical protein [Pseudohongiella sp.]
IVLRPIIESEQIGSSAEMHDLCQSYKMGSQNRAGRHIWRDKGIPLHERTGTTRMMQQRRFALYFGASRTKRRHKLRMASNSDA